MSLFNPSCCCHVASGELYLGYGSHEVNIDIGAKPCNVCFCVKDPADGCPVCYADVSKVGIAIGATGFSISADIKTNTCLIEWRCEYK